MAIYKLFLIQFNESNNTFIINNFDNYQSLQIFQANLINSNPDDSIKLYPVLFNTSSKRCSKPHIFDFIKPAQNEPFNFGLLYSHFCIRNSFFCPDNFRIPTIDDLIELQTYLGDDEFNAVSGGKLKSTNNSLWSPDNIGASNEFSFNAIGSGVRESDGDFNGLFSVMEFWTTTQFNSNNYWSFLIMGITSASGLGYNDQNKGLSVRLLASNPNDYNSGDSITDYDGNVYNIIKIGNQAWLDKNYKCTHLNDGTSLNLITDNITWMNSVDLAYCFFNNDQSYF